MTLRRAVATLPAPIGSIAEPGAGRIKFSRWTWPASLAPFSGAAISIAQLAATRLAKLNSAEPQIAPANGNEIRAASTDFVWPTKLHNGPALPEGVRTAIGIAITESSACPRTKVSGSRAVGRALDTGSADGFGGYDSSPVIQVDKYRRHYKVRWAGKDPSATMPGLAIVGHPAGRNRRAASNPVVRSNQKVLAWPHCPTVAALTGPTFSSTQHKCVAWAGASRFCPTSNPASFRFRTISLSPISGARQTATAATRTATELRH